MTLFSNTFSATHTLKMTTPKQQKHTDTRVFTPVSYRVFRQHLADIQTSTVKGKGYETVIFDTRGDIQAIVHAASIDSEGCCHPAQYHIRTSALPLSWSIAA
jgi:hypothetical protein